MTAVFPAFLPEPKSIVGDFVWALTSLPIFAHADLAYGFPHLVYQ